MRVLMLSWEYPPLVVGGLGTHVEAVSRELVAAGHEVCVVTRGDRTEPVDEVHHGVRIRRAATDPIDVNFTTETLLAWSQAAEHSLLRAALPVVRRWHPDVVHAHDWLVAQSAVTLAQVTGRPIVATIHATEAGRHQGWLPEPLNRAIHSVERWLVHEAAAIITCSTFMRDEVTTLFEIPTRRVAVVPNGIDELDWSSTPTARAAARARIPGDGPLLAFAGRLVHEKGLQTLLSALPRLRRRHPGLRLVVAGTGPYEAVLRERAKALRVARAVTWLGFVPAGELAPLLGAADVAVVPSLYEPFGLVAIEAVAAGVAVVVAETGGLRDLIATDVASASFAPGEVEGLVTAVSGLLSEPIAADRRAVQAARTVRRDFGWPSIAARTAAIYAAAVDRPARVAGRAGGLTCPGGTAGAAPGLPALTTMTKA